jgi:hypothetical protein
MGLQNLYFKFSGIVARRETRRRSRAANWLIMAQV